jgi:hypothetical protein
MRNKLRNVLVGLGAVGLLAASSPALASGAGHHDGNSCAHKFDVAQRTDMESFRDFDADTWREGHDPNAVSIYASGARFVGLDAIMAAQVNHFKNKEAVWSWTELHRRVDGCSTGYIEYEAVYEIPRVHFYQKALTVVTYEYNHGKWLSIMDQGTMLELRTS